MAKMSNYAECVKCEFFEKEVSKDAEFIPYGCYLSIRILTILAGI